MIREFGVASATLADLDESFFGTMANLDEVNQMLVENDDTVAEVNDQFADVAGFLADDREEMGKAAENLADAMAVLDDFIRENRANLQTSVENLVPTTKALQRQRDSLEEMIRLAPLLLHNLRDAYDPEYNLIAGSRQRQRGLGVEHRRAQRPQLEDRPADHARRRLDGQERAMRLLTRLHVPRPGRRAGVVGSALGLALLLTGCGLGKDLYNTPLPGGADVGDDPMTVTVDFHDVVDLVPQSSVKVENIAVGRVSTIELNPDGRSARATLVVRRDVDLPDGTTARLQQTSLLGEKYVALLRPAEGEDGPGVAEVGGAHPDPGHQPGRRGRAGPRRAVPGGQRWRARQVPGDLPGAAAGLRRAARGDPGLPGQHGDLRDRRWTPARARSPPRSTRWRPCPRPWTRDQAKIATALEGLSPGMQVLVEQRGRLVEMLTRAGQAQRRSASAP